MKDEFIAEIEQFFRAEQAITIAVVGAGGKTSLLSYLAHRLPGDVICATSTKMLASQAELFDLHIIWKNESEIVPEIPENVGTILISGISLEIDNAEKLTALTDQQLSDLKQVCDERHIHLIVEADGAKRRSLKAPEAWEPVIPAFSDLVIVVVGLKALMKPLNEEHVFRSQVFAQLTGLEMEQPVDMRAILRFLKHPLGGQKGIPDQAKRFVLFNLDGCSYPELVDEARIEDELSGVFDRIFILESIPVEL